ncbi:MAG: endonuclease/exonuclease/phosphatase family protein [Polaribacter sp.]|nr:endonuclease/exonuclease/phosphatase family protein [Polaribacter sp.]
MPFKVRSLTLFIFLIHCFTGFTQNIDDIDYGTSSSLEIISWNIENFPKNEATTVAKVGDIIEALNADIIAIQEVDDRNSFNEMVANMESYEGYLESEWFAGLAFIYNKNTIEINSIYEIYTTSQYWSPFPRSPMVMDFNFKNQRYIVINNHLKCCGDGFFDMNNSDDEETRRYNASILLKEYVDANFADAQVIILGDLNDELTDDSQDNVFRTIIEDSNNYLFTDINIANGDSSNWSFPNWPSHLDHILITNELFEKFENENSNIETIKLEEYLENGWYEYDQDISDHRPVALKIFADSNLQTTDEMMAASFFTNSPNPIKTETNFTFKSKLDVDRIEIYTTKGQRISSLHIDKNQSSIPFYTSHLANGVYFANLISNNIAIASKKIVILK